MPSAKLLAVLLLALLVLGAVPVGRAHDESGALPEHEEEAGLKPHEGYTGPSRLPYLSYFEGAWMYGQLQVRNLREQAPRDLTGDGDWLVWVDMAREDIYVHSVSAGDGFYVTNDRAQQRSPEISGRVVVWEDYSMGAARIFAYDMESGETRRLSDGPGSHRNPSIHGSLVAWEVHANSTIDLWAVDMTGGEPFPVAVGRDRMSDPLVQNQVVYYRVYRYNIWDIHAYDVARNHTYPITTDVGINTAPFSNGKDVLFLSQGLGWVVSRYDVAQDRVRATRVTFSDTSASPASGDHLLQLVLDVGRSQVVARNLTTGSTNHLTAGLNLVTNPHLEGKTAFLMVSTRNGTQLVVLTISDFAFSARPTLSITSPSTGANWMRPVTMRGTLSAGTVWTEPQTFTYRINDEPPVVIAAAPQWQATLDPAGFPPGNHQVLLRATYLEGPSVETSITLTIPALSTGLDIREQADIYHKAAVNAFYQRYFGQNSASWVLLPIVFVLLALIVMRVVIILRRAKEELVVEYVRP